MKTKFFIGNTYTLAFFRQTHIRFPISDKRGKHVFILKYEKSFLVLMSLEGVVEVGGRLLAFWGS
jgi:hypothetical protein